MQKGSRTLFRSSERTLWGLLMPGEVVCRESKNPLQIKRLEEIIITAACCCLQALCARHTPGRLPSAYPASSSDLSSDCMCVPVSLLLQAHSNKPDRKDNCLIELEGTYCANQHPVFPSTFLSPELLHCFVFSHGLMQCMFVCVHVRVCMHVCLHSTLYPYLWPLLFTTVTFHPVSLWTAHSNDSCSPSLLVGSLIPSRRCVQVCLHVEKRKVRETTMPV